MSIDFHVNSEQVIEARDVQYVQHEIFIMLVLVICTPVTVTVSIHGCAYYSVYARDSVFTASGL